MNWISHWKKIGIKVKRILKKQPVGQQETDWKNCPQCKKIYYLPDLTTNLYICECSFHFDLPPKLRLDNLFHSSYEIIELMENINPENEKLKAELKIFKIKALKEKMAKDKDKGNTQKDKIAQAMARIKKTNEDNA